MCHRSVIAFENDVQIVVFFELFFVNIEEFHKTNYI